MQPAKLEQVPIHDIHLDTRNPRIRRFLEMYTGDVTDDQISLALGVTGDMIEAGLKDATTPAKLRASIIASGGIRQPIIVNREPGGNLVCIEGNTRLWIYRNLDGNQAPGSWNTIPALVHDQLGDHDIDSIRLQAHIVGPRPWDAYSKAKYLWELQNREMMPLNRIIELCGGSKRDVQIAINTYADMEAHYRPLCVRDDFDSERYSGFVEYQNNRVQQAVLSAGYSGKDFAKWIYERKINNLQEVRQLPHILKNSAARTVFLKDGVKAAMEVVDRPDMDTNLDKASLDQLAKAVAAKARLVEMDELRRLQDDLDSLTSQYIEDAIDALSYLLSQIRNQD